MRCSQLGFGILVVDKYAMQHKIPKKYADLFVACTIWYLQMVFTSGSC